MTKNIERIGIIGGSGLGQALAAEMDGQTHRLQTPFGEPSAPVVTGEIEGVPVAFIARHGLGHVLNPSSVPYRANIYALKRLGVTRIIASGACGSLVEDIAPGELVIADQLIDKTYARGKSFFDGRLAVHVDFAYPFCEQLRRLLLDSAPDGVRTHHAGTYVCMEGPQFSTRAESLMHQQMGGHLIGMTALPEAKLAREAEICYALVTLVTDYDCWREHRGDVDKHSLMKEIIANLNQATAAAVALIRRAVKQAAALLGQDCEHHRALEMGIWSDKYHITPDTRRDLGLFIDKYLQQDK